MPFIHDQKPDFQRHLDNSSFASGQIVIGCERCAEMKIFSDQNTLHEVPQKLHPRLKLRFMQKTIHTC